ncbi:MAG: (2Fe-2S) ferredoxin domain-containing protein [Rhodospirillales bacterium]|nr:(2Fe-2S) ferredoxin domain-containing protein [Rhodospirillales bacterium]
MTDKTPRLLVVCINRRFQADKPSCAGRGGEGIADALEAGIAQRNINITLKRMICLGRCEEGPNARLAPGGDFMTGLTLDDVPALLDDLEKLHGTRDDTAAPSIPDSLPGT